MNDLKFAFRQLAKSPGFTTVAVVSLALGIGAGTAVFSLVNAILLRSLPVPNSHELRVLRWTGADVRMTSLNEWPAKNGNQVTAHSVTYPAFHHLREQGAAMADIFGFQPLDDITARARSEAFTAKGMLVTDNFFSGLGLRPILGRRLNVKEDFSGNAAGVVIAYDWWEKRFALDPGVLGQAISLNGTSFTIVGVLPRGFAGVLPGDPIEFYLPMAAESQFLYRPITDLFHWFVRLMARVRPGVSDSQLRAALTVAFARDAAPIMKDPKILVEPGNGGLAIDRNNYRQPLLLMLGAVGLIMLVACANLAGLSLARGASRQHELAVRAALGAGRWRLMLFQLATDGAGFNGAQLSAFYEQVQDSLAAIPGVRGAALLETALLGNQASSGGFNFPDRPANSGVELEAYRLSVSETFFATMGIPLLQGRGLSAADRLDAPKVVVVNETFAREFLPDENPLGRLVKIWDADWRIVGVCRAAKYANIKAAVPPTIYFPFRQRFYASFERTHLRNATFAVRTTLPPLAVATAARKAVAAINPGVPLANLTTQDAVRDKNISQERLLATLCGALASLALLLSCIGLYGLMAYHVARRTNEIAIRMAVGATRRHIAGPILAEALLLAAFGIAVGVPAALGLARLIRSQLYGVSSNDPMALGLAGLALLLVAGAAAWVPARRASNVAPMQALRAE